MKKVVTEAMITPFPLARRCSQLHSLCGLLALPFDSPHSLSQLCSLAESSDPAYIPQPEMVNGRIELEGRHRSRTDASSL